MAETATLQQIALDRIDIHKLNPRRDVGDLTELVESIKAQGVIEPIVVTPHDGGFLAVIGRRRIAAAKKAGLSVIPAVVRELSDVEAAAAALVENLQRQDLSPLDEAQAYHDLIALTGWSQRELGARLGRAQPTIANALRLLEAPKPVKDALIARAITPAHARVALQLDPSLASKLNFEKAGQMTVAELEHEVRQRKDEWVRLGPPAYEKAKAELAKATVAHPKSTITWSEEHRSWQLNLMKALGKPPAEIVGDWISRPQAHDKKCSCRAYELEVQDTYGEARLGFELKRVCIDRAGYKKYAGYAPSKSREPKGPNRAERERQIAKEARGAVFCDRSYGSQRTPGARERPVYARLAKHKDIERVVLFALVDNDYNGATILHTWNVIAKLAPAKLREFIRLHALHRTIHQKGSYGSEYADRGLEAILAHFKVEPKELGYKPREAKRKAAKTR